MKILFKFFLFSVILYLTAPYQVTLYQRDSCQCSLHWLIDYDSQSVRFSLQIPLEEISNSKPFGFGFSERGSVSNADLIRIFSSENDIVIEDCWSDEDGILYLDQTQDYKLISHETTEQYIVVTFERAFQTCDRHDLVFHNQTTNLIMVMNLPSLKLENEDTKFTERINLNNYAWINAYIQLLKPKGYEVITDGNYMTFDITSPKVIIPNVETTYWCSIHKLPDYASEVHGIGFEAIISENSHNLVHHIEVFGCDINDGDIASYNDTCESRNLPKEVKRCGHVLAAWAYGAKGIFYPKESGLTFVSPKKSQYVRLEIHYNNPRRQKGVIDQSGIRFYYSTKIRPYEVGIMEVGVIYTPDMAIPPNQTNFIWPGVCPTECTEQALPPSGINVFLSEMHTHLSGRKIRTTHFRGNSQLPDLNRDDYYSTWFEEIRKISPMRKVLPGDMLVTFCEFNTETRKQVTLGGLGIHEEMCVNYLHYYPATDLEVCKGSVAKSYLKAFLQLQNIKAILARSKESTLNKISSLADVKWTKKSVRELQYIYSDAPSDIHCLKPNREMWEGKWNKVDHVTLSNKQEQEIRHDCDETH